jgi:thioredoxin-like negative regulator of GroEL
MQKENIDNANTHVEDLEIIEINNLIDKLNYEAAQMLLHNKLQKEPNNVEALDILSEVLVSLDEVEEAKQVLVYIFI